MPFADMSVVNGLVKNMSLSQGFLGEHNMDLTVALNKAIADVMAKISEMYPRFRNTIYPRGSAVEHTQIGSSDFDYVIMLDDFRRSDSTSKVQVLHDSKIAGKAILEVLPVTDAADGDDWSDHSGAIGGPTKDKRLLSPDTLKESLLRKFENAANMLEFHPRLTFRAPPEKSTTTYHGPDNSPARVVTFEWDCPDTKEKRYIDVDLVIGIFLGKIDEETAEKLSLKGAQNGPQVLQDCFRKTELFAVGRHYTEWRISWGQAETFFIEHILGVTPGAITCYKTIKYICQTCFTNPLADSYLLKNILFAVWVRTDGVPRMWLEDQLDARLREMLQELEVAYTGPECYKSFFAGAVTIVKPTAWHRKEAIPALREFKTRIGDCMDWSRADGPIQELFSNKIACLPVYIATISGEGGQMYYVPK